MFRTVLILLAGLPMLMPQGMCLCQVLPAEWVLAGSGPNVTRLAEAEIPSRATGETGNGLSVRRCKCVCMSKKTNDDQDSRKAIDPTEAPFQDPCEHSQDCPLAKSAPVDKLTAPTFDAPSLLVPSIMFFDSAFFIPKVSLFDNTKSLPPFSPPRYLSFCTFLI